ncbi:hypothetical protein M758_5G181700 [Ceratodon purpureus]|nr:hypothetical protein M758_5G181700 [Ceratodon purpureus]KAG0617328.1 hypothetical protein M758_5G181700 [Ceratodon purpureus]
MSSLLGLEGRERRLFLSKFSDSSAGCTKKQAPTGIAGIGIPRASEDFCRMWKQPNRKKWRSAKVWIIDEIAMVSSEML